MLRDFASRAEEQVLASLVEGWASVDPDVIMNPSQLASEQTLAWNLMKPGEAPCMHKLPKSVRVVPDQAPVPCILWSCSSITGRSRGRVCSHACLSCQRVVRS